MADNEIKLFEDLPNVVSSSGRVSVDYLREVAKAFEPQEFVDYLKHPVLAGSAIHEGTLSSAKTEESSLPRKRQKTLMFIPARSLIAESKIAVESAPLQQALYPLVKSSESISKDRYLFSIGREPGSDLVIPDFSISKEHAIIRIDGTKYLLSDVGSSNGTMVNGSAENIKKFQLKDGDRITFARFDFSFIFPESLYLLLKK